MSHFHQPPPSLDDLRQRPDFDGLEFHGFDSSLSIFPHFGLSWEAVQQANDVSGKPAIDLGASFSSLAVEAELRGIQIVPLDIMQRFRGTIETYQLTLQCALQLLENFGKLPAELRGQWNEAIASVFARYIDADIAAVPFPDRSFSVALCHDAVPKHSATLEAFLEEQLPEVLRITEIAAYFFPLARHQMDDQGDLHEEIAYYQSAETLARFEAVAQTHGFSFELTSSGGEAAHAPLPQTGIFRRLEMVDLTHARGPIISND